VSDDGCMRTLTKQSIRSLCVKKVEIIQCKNVVALPCAYVQMIVLM